MKFINHKIKKNIYNIGNKYTNSKIVLISDIHYSSSFKKEKIQILINEIKKENPDYLCITGDLIDSNLTVENKTLHDEVLNFIINLSKITKVIISIGNHDQYFLIKRAFRCKHKYYENKEWFNELKQLENVYLLDNESISFTGITFNGITLSTDYYDTEGDEENYIINELNSKLTDINCNNYNVLLIHSPIHVLEDKTYNSTNINKIDLILSGHTHNGVMPPILDDIFKGNNGLFSPSGKWFFKAKFTRGKCTYKNTNLIINGAITKIHECSPKILVPLNELFPMSMDVINLSTNEKNISK